MGVPRRLKEEKPKIGSEVHEPEMGRSSAAKNVENAHDVLDVRSERRMKRRSVANRSFKMSSRGKGAKKTTPMEIVLLDEDCPIKETPQAVAIEGKVFNEDCTIKEAPQAVAIEGKVLDEDCTIKETPQAVAIEGKVLDEEYELYLDRFCNNNCNHAVKDNDLDLQYEIFLGSVKEDGNSFLVEVSIDGLHVVLKYEEDHWFGNGCVPRSQYNLRTATKRENMGNPEGRMDDPARGRKTLIDNKKLRLDSTKNVISAGLSSSKLKCKREREPFYNGPDECYGRFLERAEQDGSCLVLLDKQGKRVKYEEDEESESDSEILVLEADPCSGGGKETPQLALKLFDSSHIKDHKRTGPSQFRDNLMDILEQPYDQLEYERLFYDINERKPLERHRDLRGRIKRYSLEICSKSYLDHHIDLKRMIDAAQGDRYKILNLLRGFFYWLKNLSHEGAFRPWEKASSLNVMPQTVNISKI